MIIKVYIPIFTRKFGAILILAAVQHVTILSGNYVIYNMKVLKQYSYIQCLVLSISNMLAVCFSSLISLYRRTTTCECLFALDESVDDMKFARMSHDRAHMTIVRLFCQDIPTFESTTLQIQLFQQRSVVEVRIALQNHTDESREILGKSALSCTTTQTTCSVQLTCA